MHVPAFPVLSPSCARRWLAEGRPVGHHQVDGSLLFADISGFTRLSERLARRGRAGAEEVVRLVSEVMTSLVAEIEARDGDILVFAGDALVVLFEGEDAPTRAVRTAAAIRHWFAERDAISTSAGRVALRVSVGVATGPVDLVLAGGDEAGLFVAGATASEMVRLERAAAAGEVLVCERTAGAVSSAWLGEARDGARLLGRPARAEALAAASADTGASAARPSIASAAEARSSAVGRNEPRLVPLPVRTLLDAGPLALESDHRLAAIAFVLAGGLDARLAAEPEAVAADLDELYRAASAAAARHGVTLLGPDVTADGVGLFLAAGAPVATGGEEERMLRVLRELLDAPFAGRLALRAGANRGPVFAGIVGAPHRGTYTAMGDTTNLAARIANRAAAGELLATADVVARSAVEFETIALPAFTPKGKRDPVIPLRVGRPIGRQVRTPARLPLAGRDAELGGLRRALEDAVAGRGGTVTVVGDPGSGKSRLVQELTPDPQIAARLVARFTPAEETTPYGGVRGALRGLAGIPDDADPAAAGERLGAWVDDIAPPLRPWAPLLAIPFGAAVVETPEVAGLSPSFRRERLHAALGDLLAVALPTPAVLVLEDLHWADEASWALLEALAESPASASWLVLALQRPGEREFRHGAAERISLGGLDEAAVARLALDAAGETPLSDAELEAIVARAAGNPLFVRELAAVTAEHGGTDALPDRLESLLASRIDRLPATGRALLRRAAVLGRTVELDLLADVLEGDDVAPGLAHDVTAWAALDEFIAPVDSGRVRFRHDLVRDAAYEGLSHARRQGLHARLAGALERRAGPESDDVAATLALHFSRGGLPEPAFRYARRAGDIARGRYANVDAAALYRRALDAAGALRTLPPAEVAAVAESLGDVAELAGRYDDALDAYRRARALERDGAAAEDTPAAATAALALARLARKTGIVCERAGRYRDALTWYARGRRRLEGLAAPEAEALRIRLDLDRAGIRFRQGRYGACVTGALPAAEAAERAGERALLAHAYYLLHAAYGDLGSPEVAKYRSLALPIYAELDDLVGQGNVLNNLGIEAYFEGRWDDALVLYDWSKQAKTQAGDVANAATQSNNEAEILSDQGRYAEAEALLRDALRVWGAAGYEIGIALATSNLGRAAARAGRHAEGLAHLEEAAGRFERIGASGYVDETRARVAECLALAGRSDEAEAVAEETLVRVRREAETSVLEAQLERTVGWCHWLRGDASAAGAHLDASLAVARGMGAGFEIALTQRSRLALPDLGPAERASAAEEAERLLASLGVIAVPEPSAGSWAG